MIMKIRRGEDTQTPKQLIDFFERKSTGKSKREKRIATISLEEKAETPMETQAATIPTTETPAAPAKKSKPMSGLLEEFQTEYKSFIDRMSPEVQAFFKDHFLMTMETTGYTGELRGFARDIYKILVVKERKPGRFIIRQLKWDEKETPHLTIKAAKRDVVYTGMLNPLKAGGKIILFDKDKKRIKTEAYKIYPNTFQEVIQAIPHSNLLDPMPALPAKN